MEKPTESLKLSDQLLQILPELSNHPQHIEYDEKTYCTLHISNVSKDQFKAYVKACQKQGFVHKLQQRTGYYQARDDQDFFINISLNDDMMTVYVDLTEASDLNKDHESHQNDEINEFLQELTDLFKDF